jgi:hypothetical protein
MVRHGPAGKEGLGAGRRGAAPLGWRVGARFGVARCYRSGLARHNWKDTCLSKTQFPTKYGTLQALDQQKTRSDPSPAGGSLRTSKVVQNSQHRIHTGKSGNQLVGKTRVFLGGGSPEAHSLGATDRATCNSCSCDSTSLPKSVGQPRLLQYCSALSLRSKAHCGMVPSILFGIPVSLSRTRISLTFNLQVTARISRSFASPRLSPCLTPLLSYLSPAP